MMWEKGRGRTGKVGSLHPDQVAFDAFAEPHDGFARDVLAEKVVFHAFDGLDEVFLGERLAADDVAEQSSDCAQT